MEENIKLTKDEGELDSGTPETCSQETIAVEIKPPGDQEKAGLAGQKKVATIKGKTSGSQKQATPAPLVPPQAEDKIFRMAFQCFTDEALPIFNVSGKPKGILPTEETYLEWAYRAGDFVLEMDDGLINHFQFQAKNGGKKDLRRFRVTESLLSKRHEAPVITNVIFSGNVRNPMTELTEGINTYKVKAIMMKDYDADRVLVEAQEKTDRGETLTNGDFLKLSLTPLMSGKISVKDRILAAFRFLPEKKNDSNDEVHKFATILYTFATKFLKGKDLVEVREVLRMTELGRLLVEDAVTRNTIEHAKGLLDVLDVKTIAEKLGLTVDFVSGLKKETSSAKPKSV